MGTGKLIRFDMDKGYGFIAQDSGGEDVFLHVNELLNVGSQIGTGTKLRYNVMDGARGLKAYDVQVIENYHSDEETADSAPAADSVPAANGSNGHSVSNGGDTNGNGASSSSANGSNGSGDGGATGHAGLNGVGNAATAGNDTVVVNASPARIAALVSNGTAVAAAPAQAAVPPQGGAPAQERAGTREATDDDTCEVFSQEEFTCRITNLILESVPQLTGAHVLELRKHLLEFARNNSWID